MSSCAYSYLMWKSYRHDTTPFTREHSVSSNWRQCLLGSPFWSTGWSFEQWWQSSQSGESFDKRSRKRVFSMARLSKRKELSTWLPKIFSIEWLQRAREAAASAGRKVTLMYCRISTGIASSEGCFLSIVLNWTVPHVVGNLERQEPILQA